MDTRNAPLLAQILDTVVPLDFGTFGGLPVKILWCLGDLSPGLLAISGSLIWWKRRRIGRRSRASSLGASGRVLVEHGALR